MHKLDWKVVTLSLGTFMAITYALCVAYGVLISSRGHAVVFETVFPGFTWLNATSFVIGLIEAFVYGAYAGALYSALYNYFGRRAARDAEHRVPSVRAA